MEVEISRIHRNSTKHDVKREIAKFLHTEDFTKGLNDENSNIREINFKVELNEGVGGVGTHNGTGKLILPNPDVGAKFFRLLYKRKPVIECHNQKLHFRKLSERPPLHIAQGLDKTPYLDPRIEEELEEKLAKLDVGLHVDKVQFGVYFLEPEDPPTAPRKFSVEFELKHHNRGVGILQFEYLHKLIRIQLGDPVTEQIAHNIAIEFVNIRKMAIGVEFGNPAICFDLLTPAIFQREDFNRTLTGEEKKDQRKFRKRVDSVHPGHAAVAPYAHQLRILLHDTYDLDTFEDLCYVAELPRPRRVTIQAYCQGFFTNRKLHMVRQWLLKCPFPVAFQIEALLRNGMVNTQELLTDLMNPINALRKQQGEKEAADVLRHFTEKLQERDRRDSILHCFREACQKIDIGSHGTLPAENVARTPGSKSVKRDNRKKNEKRDGNFPCHHVTVTPSRLLFEGPYAIQSNRVIRKYSDHPDNFIRIDFRDEDRLQYRWARDVDGHTLLNERVGYTLKNGLEIAGRRFDFLAYSNSALREHAVWFVHPLYDPTTARFIDANEIRDGLGDFSELTRMPSKYAARLGQAFTATDPSVTITRDQWEEMDDLGSKPYLFTDGIGTISKGLGDLIWAALCRARGGNGKEEQDSNIVAIMTNSIQPSAYQIRFLGYKGMVVIDYQLEGITMRLRPSMRKFEVAEQKEADIEIARAFERPGKAYLNRPLITILEDRGVEKKAFLKLQEQAISEIEMSSDTVSSMADLFKKHQLGSRFRLPNILSCLAAVNMRTPKEARDAEHVLKDPFFDRLIYTAKYALLRDIKFTARIPIKEGYHTVGVADEGPTYRVPEDEVYKLKEGEIFLCIHEPGKEPIYIQGEVTVSRSPTVHPGDVQRVFAIGKPPDGKLCFFRNLENVVVFPSVGHRSLPSMLGGGDLDGDLYSVIKDSALLPTEQSKAANYEGMGTWELDRVITIDDVCDFIVTYIESDLLGLLSDRHIVIADQSKIGSKDKACMKLARLCSQAVDFPKNGIAVNAQDMPRQLIPFKPDWKRGDNAITRDTEFYESTRALGVMFRSENLSLGEGPLVQPLKISPTPQPLGDPISNALRETITRVLGHFENSDRDVGSIKPLFLHYASELKYISYTHSLSDSPDSRLKEEEIVVGTILDNCANNSYRKNRMYRMGVHSQVLLREVRDRLYVQGEEEQPSRLELEEGLSRAWCAWDFGMRNRAEFGANSFALIALGVVMDILVKELKEIDLTTHVSPTEDDDVEDDEE